jgi:hypothetical protein
MNNIVYKAVRDSVNVAVWDSVWYTLRGAACHSVRNYVGITVWSSIKISVYIPIQQSVEDYFYTNSDIIKQ